MLIVHRTAAGERELHLAVDRRQVTVAELADAIGETGRSLVIDGRPVGRDLGLDETPLVAGSVVWSDDECTPKADSGAFHSTQLGAGLGPIEAGRRHVAVLVVGAGLQSGQRVLLAPGSWLVGRRPGDGVELESPTVSARHARLRIGPDGLVEVRDLGSRNGTWLGDSAVGRDWAPVPPNAVVRFGAVYARVERLDHLPADRPTTVDQVRNSNAFGRLTFNRPPRPPEPAGPDAVRLPRPPTTQGPRPVLAILPALLPAVLGVVTVMVTGNWLFALLPLLSPVIAVASWWQSRRRAGRISRREHARFQQEIHQARRHLATAADVELARRRASLPDIGEVLRRGHQPSSRLWERRPGAPGWLRLTAGVGTIPWRPPTEPAQVSQEQPAEDLRTLLAEAGRLVDAPAEVDLADGGVVGIVGPPDVARAVARSLVGQAVVHQGPADLRLVVLSSVAAAAEWEWCRWLPHVESEGAPTSSAAATQQFGVGMASATALLRGLLKAAAEDVGISGHRAGPARQMFGSRNAPTKDGQPGQHGPVYLIVVDDDELLAGPRAPARAVLRGEAGPVAGIVVAGSIDRLPASCTTVIELRGADGRATAHRLAPTESERGADVELVVGCLSEPAARHLSLALCRFEDGEQASAAGLVRQVRLFDLLGMAAVDPDAVARRWRTGATGGSLAVPLGVTADGPLVVDLVSDGPHALVAGTTGAGKSELLRSWVAGLAATVHPELLNFVLIDYKGGSAFDQCAHLPHTVAVVTDLDESLAERALRCLEAELRHREAALREAGANDLDGYRRVGSDRPPLPRLVVMVDEFATLAAELPGFLDALVGVAQRGRSLGVHLVLATQRPAGVVGDNIRANTALRVALRVQDRHDSVDVLGSEEAAALPRETPGRAVVRFGPGEAVVMQTALVSSVPPGPGRRLEVRALPPLDRVRALERQADDMSRDAGASSDIPTDLAVLVDAAVRAARELRLAPPRSPWPPPLPEHLELDQLDDFPARCGRPAESRGVLGLVELFLVDDPDRQAQYVGGWKPLEGNLLVAGPVGSGTTTTLATLVISLTRRVPPDRAHVYVIDAAAGALEPLADLPHCAGVVRLGDEERLVGLVNRLRDELELRRSLDEVSRHSRPTLVLVIDGWPALQAELEQPGQLALGEDLARIISEGPDLGIRTAMAADRPSALRARLGATMTQRLLLRPGELDAVLPARAASRSSAAPSRQSPPGRGFDERLGLAVQVAVAAADGDLVSTVGSASRRWPDSAGQANERPQPLGRLPFHVDLRDVLAAVSTAHEPGRAWHLPIGLTARDMAPAGWTIHDGDHVLITGPARSGRSTALCSVALALRDCRPDLTIVAVASRRSPLGSAVVSGPLAGHVAGHMAPDEIGELAAWIEQGPTAVLVDDAETVDDPTGSLARWIEAHRADVLVVAAARNDAARSQYGSWLRRLRPSRLGLLLQAEPEADGDLLGVRLPRRQAAPAAPGRGYLVNGGRVELVQVAASEPTGL